MDKLDLLRSFGYSEEFIKHLRKDDHMYSELPFTQSSWEVVNTNAVDTTELIVENPHLSGSADFTIIS